MSITQNEQRIDPDTDFSRLKRAFNQFGGEQLFLENAPSYSLQERLIQIRSFIFKDFPNVWGQKREEIIAQGYTKGWPDKDLLADYYWPDFCKKIDILNKELCTVSPSERESASLRISVLVYFFGILLHPSVDGNGQSFRILALSYIRQHSEQYSGSFFPIKYIQDYGASIGIHPITEQLVRDIAQKLRLKNNESDESTVKEKVLTTLLKTKKGDTFLREYLRGDLQINETPKNDYEQSAFIFERAFDSLKTDFQTLLETENEITHTKKHVSVQELLKKYSVSLKEEFTLSQTEKESITAMLRSI